MSEFSTVDSSVVDRLLTEMQTHGVAKLEGAISQEHLDRSRNHLFGERQGRAHEYFAIHCKEDLVGSPFEALKGQEEFVQLLADLYKKGLGEAPPSRDITLEVRCVQGQSGQRESYYFHYDATVITALVPVIIPTEEGNCGDFITFPNLRKVRRNILTNVLEKAVMQNTLSQKLTALAIKMKLIKPVKVKLEPGSVYFFWGYQSLHANEPCDPHLLRATALYHFGNPHQNSEFAKRFMARNIRRAHRERDAKLQGNV